MIKLWENLSIYLDFHSSWMVKVQIIPLLEWSLENITKHLKRNLIMLEKKKKLDMVTSDLLFYEFSNYKSSLDNGFLYILQKNHWKSSKFLSSSSSLFCYDEGYFKVTKGFRICIFLKLNIIKLKNSLFSASEAVILF